MPTYYKDNTTAYSRVTNVNLVYADVVYTDIITS